MIEFLIRRFVPDWQQVQRTDVRERYGTLAAAVGILSNIFLCIIKGLIGLFSGSIAVTADAVNNLSDAGSSVITLLAFKIAGKPADEEHPYGHARMEYISGMAVSFIIILLGLELMGSSFEKILHPEEVGVSALTYLVLIVSIAVKLWQGMFNRNLGKRISSEALQATAADSLNDVFSTGAVLLSTLVYQFTAIPIDGWVGMLVAIFITVSGVKLIMETGSPLLGQAPDPQMVRELEEKITAYDGVIGIHDLQVHNYGPGRVFATVHAEVPANRDILVSHDIIDNIEREVGHEMNLNLVIHMDPVVTDDERLNQLHAQVQQIVVSIDSDLSMHDFRAVFGPTHTNLVFDVVVPPGFSLSDSELSRRIEQQVQTLGSYFCVITVDHNYAYFPQNAK
ncbi:MAG TPA: cation diffusion facilitator family transporter [Candidatus Negativibacillus faecipullorum]|nr:cation diffusion facilitator family transporter [Candidatus Negativibacillus faecipullorum]